VFTKLRFVMSLTLAAAAVLLVVSPAQADSLARADSVHTADVSFRR
jgi:hypothetical protein